MAKIKNCTILQSTNFSILCFGTAFFENICLKNNKFALKTITAIQL